MDDIGDRIRGALLGLAAGDRIGGPTAMAMRLLEGVVARGSCDVDETRGRYLAWHRAEGFDQGPTSARVLDLLAGGCAPALAVARADAEAGGLTGGCNPMHRAGPLGAAFVVPDAALAEAARADAAITHAHPLAGEAAAAAASLLRLVLRGVAWDDAASRAAAGRAPAIAHALGGGGHATGAASRRWSCMRRCISPGRRRGSTPRSPPRWPSRGHPTTRR
ncbi:MAG: ADP-ribosylglycohydrolase family protein [Alphaproteobacteria bacterium]